MFDLEKVALLNDLEMIVYQFILEHMQRVPSMTIRQLSSECHVSTSTILRFCTKMGYQGFSELKYAVKQEESQSKTISEYYDATLHMESFLKKMTNETYTDLIEQAVDLLVAARHVAFVGIGTSGVLGQYGSRYFTNVGINAYSIADPFTPIPPRGFESTLAFVLSVSGETTEVVKQVTELKRAGAMVLSITNNEQSTVARLADHNISYYMPDEHVSDLDPFINLTTQVPVIALLELLAHRSRIRLSTIGN